MIPTESIKKWATAVGFDLCGIAPADPLPQAEQAFRAWIARGAQGPLDYLTRHTEKRFHAARLVDQARTVIVCAVSYKSPISMLYCDNAATTGMAHEALCEMLPYMREKYGNPSSVYGFSDAPREGIRKARMQVAHLIGAKPEEIYFTSGGSESDNWVPEVISLSKAA